MLFRLLILVSVALPTLVAQRWKEFRSGPFEVLTDSGDRQGREALNRLEQFRHALASVLGEQELRSVWPIRIVLFDRPRDYSAYAAAAGLGLGRDAVTGAAQAGAPLPRPLLRDCALILMDSSLKRLPGYLEAGMAALFSTLEVEATRITLGRPPPAAERDLNWATLHMLAVTPDYYGKLRVLMRNLGRGVEVDPAYRNALEKTPAEIAREAQAYLAAGNYQTAPVSARVIHQEKEFAAKPVGDAAARIALADLWLAGGKGGAEAAAAYEAVLKASPESPEALEGLGLLALRAGKREDAVKRLLASVEAGTQSARALVEYARLEIDHYKAVAALQKAAGLNPRWAAPHFEMGKRTTDTKKKVELLKTAAELEPRSVACWRALAEAHAAQEQFADAARAWVAAEQAAPDEAERKKLRQIRAETEKKRLEQEEAERKRLADEERRDLERVKQEAVAAIQAALAEANRGSAPRKPGEEVVEWWEDPKAPAKAEGMLRAVDCLGSQVRLVIDLGKGKLIRLMVREPGRIAVRGDGRIGLPCGPQRPPRKIVVEYFPKPDARLGAAGDAAAIEFVK